MGQRVTDLKLAKAVVENAIHFDGEWSNDYFCIFCRARDTCEEVEHEADCAVLVAEKILAERATDV